MKELSIEEKAERYDKAIEKLRSLHDDYDTVSTLIDIKEELENIFPELKESEDDRIMKAILIYLDWLDGRIGYEPKGEYSLSDMIAWVKKQGEHANFRNKIQVGDKVTRNEDGELVNLSQLQRVAKPCKGKPKFRIGDIIHKIGENTIFPMVIEEIKNGEYVCDNNHSFINIEFQDGYELVEQKHANKVETKFRVGDWVVSPNGVYWHVDAIQDGRYQVSSNSGECTDWSLNTNIYHKFTIQDAKDGDVLSYRGSQWIFIYKEKINDNSFYYHTLYSTIHKDLTIKDAGYTLLVGAITPATKEQRDLLFQKMKEAGYEWDAKKKELKKIEQKPAWSKEDDNILATIIEEGDLKPSERQWLKSLKDRVQPQKTWKPNEGQMEALNYMVNLMASSKSPKENDYYYNVFKNLREQLKKLMEE